MIFLQKAEDPCGTSPQEIGIEDQNVWLVLSNGCETFQRIRGYVGVHALNEEEVSVLIPTISVGVCDYDSRHPVALHGFYCF